MVWSAANSLLLADVAAIEGFPPSVVSSASADTVHSVKADVQPPLTCPAQFVETHRHVCHSFMGDDG